MIADEKFDKTIQLTQLDALIQIGKQLKRIADHLEVVAVDYEERVKRA